MRLAMGVTALATLAACGRTASPDRSFRDTKAQLRRGNLDEATRLAGSAPRPDDLWKWRFRMLDAEIALARGQAEEVLGRLTDAAPSGPEFSEGEARRCILRADALIKLDRYADARQAIEEARRRIVPQSGPELQTDFDLQNGLLLMFTNRLPEAETAFFHALNRATTEHELYQQATAYLYLGLNQIRAYRYDAGLLLTDQARRAAEQAGAERLRASALGNLGLCYARLGDFEKAQAYGEQVIPIRKRTHDTRSLQAAHGILGNIYMLSGETQKAIPHYRSALQLARELKAQSYVSVWAANLAGAAAEAGDWDSAEQLSREAKGGAFQDAQTLVSGKLTDAAIAAGRKRYGEGERLYQEAIAAAPGPGQLWEAHAGLAGLYVESGNQAKAAPHFETAIWIIEKTRADLFESEHKITFLSRLIRFYQAYVEMLMERGAREKAFAVAESSRARILAERMGGAPSSGARTVPGALQSYRDAARRANLVLLSYWVAPKRSFLWAISPGAAETFVLPGEAELSRLVTGHQDDLLKLHDPLQSPQSPGRRLYEVLLRPAEKLIPPGARVVLVPDRALHRLNFETLAAGGEPAHFWIEDVVLSVAPSVSVALEQANGAAQPPKSLLLVGAAEPPVADYPKLPEAGREIEAIHQKFPGIETTMATGARATPAFYRQSHPERFSLIHFAAHGRENRASPLDSAIVLSPQAGAYLLYARDIAKLPLKADLVAVASCRSAGAREYPGEGLVGLAWAFLKAGARNVIAGLWDVSDQSTADVMAALYTGIAAGRPPEAALRDAKLVLVRGKAPYRLPYYWGPFQIYR